MCYAATVYVNFLFSFSTAAGLSLGLKIVVEIQWNSVFRSLKQRVFVLRLLFMNVIPTFYFLISRVRPTDTKGSEMIGSEMKRRTIGPYFQRTNVRAVDCCWRSHRNSLLAP